MEQVSWNDFQKIDLRVGTILKAFEFPEARKPAYILHIDFGPLLGIKKSSAQITERYSLEQLIGKQVVAVVNFAPKQIGPVMSECLVTGFHTESGVVLVTPDDRAGPVPNGSKLA
ncbi:MAG: tRNA-binding protein [Bdellovibrionales bacterium]|nr:tRNA-binding protein [Bdellovibrionales bacterium]